MKRLNVLLVSVIAAMAFTVNSNAQISVGVGYANETLVSKTVDKLGDNVKGKSVSRDYDKYDGFYIEASYNWEFASVAGGSLALQPGLKYYCLTDLASKDKANVKEDGNTYKGYSKVRMSNHLLDIPVNVKYAYEFVPGALKGYVFAGPVFSIGLSAKYNEVSKYSGENLSYKEVIRYNVYTGKYFESWYNDVEDKIETEKGKSDDYKAYNAFDLKLGLGLGVTLAEKVDVKFGYNIGLLNMDFIKNRNNEKYAAHTNILYFGVAYNF